MIREMDVSNIHISPVRQLGPDFSGTAPGGDVLAFNNYYMEKNGKPYFAVSGEFHYSRMDERRWEDEIIKMRMGGVNIISTYLFWNHIEEEEGVFDFSGRRNVRRFVELCGKHGMDVILRIGPFAHGEVRNGGLPDWLYGKPFEVRSLSEGFLACVRKLYAQIAQQVHGLFFRDGGPIIGIQLDNEYMHSSAPWEITTGISGEWVNPGRDGEAYILALRTIALECGLTPAFFTGTAWGGAAYSDRVMPLWGGYAYRPWIFYSHQGEHPATEEYLYEDYHHNGSPCADDFLPAYPPEDRPYACCEMGAGMMCCYYYRFIYPYKCVDALANIKLGSGCNFIGYYMFHGGTNPLGRHGTFLNEGQVPKRSYDYQAALGEFGQVRESYSRLKSIHSFLKCFGDRLAPMETRLDAPPTALSPEDLDTLRFAVRTDGVSGFLFINNFQDHRTMPRKEQEEVILKTAGDSYRFRFSIDSDENAILPFHFDMDGILLRQANAQPVLRTVVGGQPLYVFMVPDGMDGGLSFEEAARVTGAAPLLSVEKGNHRVQVLVISRAMANQMFLLQNGGLVFTDGALLEGTDGTLRLESTSSETILCTYPADLLSRSPAAARLPDRNVFGVYQVCVRERTIPVRVAQASPQRWTVQLPAQALEGVKDVRLRIDYRGDIGMLFLGSEMVSDHFCNGDTWEFGLMEYQEQLDNPFVLYIAPLRKGSHVNVESGMAGRSEQSDALISDLISIQAQPVYEIGL